MAMMDRGQTTAEDNCTKANDEILSKDISAASNVDVGPVVEDGGRRNSSSGAPENGTGAPVSINPHILRRPTRRPADPDEDKTDGALPVPARVELDVGFQRGVPIPDLPNPHLDASSKSEAFENIRRWLLDGAAATPRQEVRDDEVGDDALSSDESDGDVRELLAVDSLKYFLGNIHFDDVTMASQDSVLS